MLCAPSCSRQCDREGGTEPSPVVSWASLPHPLPLGGAFCNAVHTRVDDDKKCGMVMVRIVIIGKGRHPISHSVIEHVQKTNQLQCTCIVLCMCTCSVVASSHLGGGGGFNIKAFLWF